MQTLISLPADHGRDRGAAARRLERDRRRPGRLAVECDRQPGDRSISATAPATANVTITSATGQTAYTGTLALNSRSQSFTWNGQGNKGVTWPDGNYTIAISATGANGQPVSVSTQVQGVVTAVDVSQTPPQLTVGGQKVPISQIQSISR
jgi:flagellar basal-body rod modification protein FlgD